MTAKGCDVFLDPWVKDNLEGHALLLQRIPDTPESTHHGVTCQRWHVRFHEDQDISSRWLDYGDAITWEPPTWNISLLQTQIPSHTFTQAEYFKHVMIGNVQTTTGTPTLGAKILVPKAGRIRNIALYMYTGTMQGTPPLLRIAFFINAVYQTTQIITDSNLSGKHLFQTWTDLTIYPFSDDHTIACYLYSYCAAEEELPVYNVLLDLHLQWGNFT